MSHDRLYVFSDAQAVTSTADSTSVIDFGVADVNKGAGTPLVLEITVNTTCTASGSATVTVDVQDSADASSYAAIGIYKATIAKATLVAGYVIYRGPLPHAFRRYMKIIYTVATGPLTAGAFDAYIRKG